MTPTTATWVVLGFTALGFLGGLLVAGLMATTARAEREAAQAREWAKRRHPSSQHALRLIDSEFRK